MKKMLTIIALLISMQAISTAQTDSLHMLIKDTILKSGDVYTIAFEFEENLSNIAGFQFCIGYDPVNLQFNSIKKIHIPAVTPTDININPQGNQDKITTIGLIENPYNGTKIFDLTFNVLNDCRIKNVIQILSLFRYKEGESYLSSEAYDFDGNTLPIATKYLPFVELGSNPALPALKTTVFPNPSSNLVNLEFENQLGAQTAQATIYDAAGKKVHTKSFNLSAGTNNLQFERTNFGTSGVYYIKLLTETFTVSGQVYIVD